MYGKGKITVEEKVKIVRAYPAGTISQADAARRGVVVPSTIEGWARIYRKEGVIDLAAAGKNRVYSPELKNQAVEEYLASKCSQTDVCEKHEIHTRKQVQNWAKSREEMPCVSKTRTYLCGNSRLPRRIWQSD